MSVRKQGAKEHHTVPRCYLKSWADVETPTDQTPYLWVVDLSSGRVFRRAPKNTFVENDFYVIKGKGGIRDLRLISGKDDLSDYQFGSNQGHHRFCKTCGIAAFGDGYVEAIGGAFVSINVACLDDISPEELAKLPIQYMDGRHDNWFNPPKVTSYL